jgi:hypothetical protein
VHEARIEAAAIREGATVFGAAAVGEFAAGLELRVRNPGVARELLVISG